MWVVSLWHKCAGNVLRYLDFDNIKTAIKVFGRLLCWSILFKGKLRIPVLEEALAGSNIQVLIHQKMTSNSGLLFNLTLFPSGRWKSNLWSCFIIRWHFRGGPVGTSTKYFDFWNPSLPLFHISHNLSVLGVIKIRHFPDRSVHLVRTFLIMVPYWEEHIGVTSI